MVVVLAYGWIPHTLSKNFQVDDLYDRPPAAVKLEFHGTDIDTDADIRDAPIV